MIALVAVLCTLWATSAAHVLVAVDDGGTVTYYTVPVAVPEAQPGPQFGVQPRPPFGVPSRPPFGVQPRRGFGARPPPINPDAEEVPPVNTGPGGGGAGRPGFVPVLPRARPGGVPGMVPGGYPTVVYHQGTPVIVYGQPPVMPRHRPQTPSLPPYPPLPSLPPAPRAGKPECDCDGHKEKEGVPKKPSVVQKRPPDGIEGKSGVPPPPPSKDQSGSSDGTQNDLMPKDRFRPDVKDRIEADKQGDEDITTTPTAAQTTDAAATTTVPPPTIEASTTSSPSTTTLSDDDDVDKEVREGFRRFESYLNQKAAEATAKESQHKSD